MGAIWDTYDKVNGGKCAYYHRWFHQLPMFVSDERHQELARISDLLARCLLEYGRVYREYLHVIPFEQEVLDLLALVDDTPYRLGTARPDFLIGLDGRIRLCEITSRFFGNGGFISYFSEAAARLYAQEQGVAMLDSGYESQLEYIASLLDGKEGICFLRSADKTSTIGLATPFFEALGKKVYVIEPDDIERSLPLVSRCFIASALNQADLLAQPRSVHETMIEHGAYNDFRTVFLAHDKRLFTLLHDDDFLARCLSGEEAAFLKDHIVETYLSPFSGASDCKNLAAPHVWKDAYLHKDGYILKHAHLGKSEKVYAGRLTSEAEWRTLWDTGIVRDMVLQPFVEQRRIPHIWEGTCFEDYAVGQMLCIDGRYFGLGVFRASSTCVTNVGDDRKISALRTRMHSPQPCYQL